jgi:hypothetical protein
MTDPSLEVRGALFHFLLERADTSRVETPFGGEELFVFVTKYFHDCLAAPAELADESKWVLGSFDLTLRSDIGRVTFGNSKTVLARDVLV